MNRIKISTLLAVFMLAAFAAHAQDDILIRSDFESSLGSWTATSDAGLYTWGGDPAVNYATAGSGAAYMFRSYSAPDVITLTTPLLLDTKGYTSVTLSFDHKWDVTEATVRWNVQYSSDGGTNWTNLGDASSTTAGATYSKTLSEGTYAFTDNALFRIGFTGTGSEKRGYADNILITASPLTGIFWDSNGSIAGAGTTPTGTWGTDLFWSTSAAGDVATGGWTANEVAVFAAGSDATGPYTVTVNGTQNIGDLIFQDGSPTLTGGALQMTSDSRAYVGAGLTASVATPLSDDGLGTYLLIRDGTGKLTLSGDNSGATGGMALDAGITQFDSTNSINGTARNVTVNLGATAMFGSSFGAVNIPAALLNRIVASSAGAIAADNYDTTAFDFNTAGLTSASLGAVGTVNYTGTLTPNGTTYRLGGGGGTLTLNSALNSANGLIVSGPGTLQFNGHDATVTGFAGSGQILENGSATTAITLTVNNAAAISYAGLLQDGGSQPLSLVKTNSGTLTLSGANAFTGNITISGGALTFSTLNAWGGSGKNVTFTGSGTLTSSADGYSGGTITANSGTATYTGGNATFSSVTGSGALVYSTTTQGKLLNIGNASSLTGTLKLKYNGNLNYAGNTALQFSSLGDGSDSLLQFESGGSDSGQGVAVAFNGAEAITFNNRQVQFLPRTTSNWSLRDLILKNNSTDSAAKWVINTALNNRSCRNHNFILGGSNTNDNEFAGVIGNSTNGVYYSTQTGILSLQKVDAGRWILSGQNTYTGITTVNGGTLVLRGEESIIDTGTLNITSGQVEIETREAIAVLQINGTPVASGIWGTTASGAPNVDNINLSGTGKLYVGEPFPPAGTVFIIK